MIDKDCIRQIFGYLMREPQILGKVDKYSLSLIDFQDSFYGRIFSAIDVLYHNGAKTIKPIDIENVLSVDQVSAQIFKNNQGIRYLQDAEALTESENFDYYYNRLKKINLLNDLNKNGFDTKEFYSEDFFDPKAKEINQQFNQLTVKDIVEKIKGKIIKLESNYSEGDVTESSSAFEGMDDLLASLCEGNEIGEPLQGEIFNHIVSGASFGKFYIRSAASGTGKTRQSVGDACYLAYPFRYDEINCKWINDGNDQKVLFIATEQNKTEIQKMILAYLTGINESRFKYMDFNESEQKIIRQALWVMEKYRDNFIITRMPNPTIELVKTIVRENCMLYDIHYVFYDYIFISPSLLGEFKGFNLRNDEVLLMFATALKDLAVELNIFVMSSTQLNASGDNNQDIRNESALAGGRATINKADVGVIVARVKKEELEFIEPYITKYHEAPNMVTDIYKVRSGEFTQVRIWSNINLGTMRKRDLFLTDSRFNEVEGFTITKVIEFDKDEKLLEVLKELND